MATSNTTRRHEPRETDCGIIFFSIQGPPPGARSKACPGCSLRYADGLASSATGGLKSVQLIRRCTEIVLTVDEHSVPPPIYAETRSFERQLQNEKDGDNAEDRPRVQGSAEDIVELAPPTEISSSDNVFY